MWLWCFFWWYIHFTSFRFRPVKSLPAEPCLWFYPTLAVSPQTTVSLHKPLMRSVPRPSSAALTLWPLHALMLPFPLTLHLMNNPTSPTPHPHLALSSKSSSLLFPSVSSHYGLVDALGSSNEAFACAFHSLSVFAVFSLFSPPHTTPHFSLSLSLLHPLPLSCLSEPPRSVSALFSFSLFFLWHLCVMWLLRGAWRQGHAV